VEAAAGLAADFLEAAGVLGVEGIVFVVLEDLAAGISNAGYTLYPPDLFKSQTVEGAHHYEAERIWIHHIVQECCDETGNLHLDGSVGCRRNRVSFSFHDSRVSVSRGRFWVLGSQSLQIVANEVYEYETL
jgi:hypothetical protein